MNDLLWTVALIGALVIGYSVGRKAGEMATRERMVYDDCVRSPRDG